MRPSKYATDPTTIAQVAAIEAGTLTRQQAADSLGISVQTFNNRLKRGGHAERLRTTINFARGQLFNTDPDKVAATAAAYEEALAQSTPAMKATVLHARFPHLSYQILVRKLKAYREARLSPEDRANRASIEALRQELKTPRVHRVPRP